MRLDAPFSAAVRRLIGDLGFLSSAVSLPILEQ